MPMKEQTWVRVLRPVTRHPVAAAIVAALGMVIVVNAVVQGDVTRAVAYLGTVTASAVLAELILARWPAKELPSRIRRPAMETLVIAASTLAAIGWLTGRFVFDYRPVAGLARLAWLAVLLTCVFDIGLAVFFLARRYRLADLGLRLAGLAPVPVIVALFATVSRVFFPAQLAWGAVLEETGGSWFGIVSTAISAALPEEFLRFLWQTRVTAWLGTPAAGWLVASVAWALLHAPVDWSQSHSWPATAMGVVNIIPLGLLWGYLTYRTRSFVPSMLIHGFNVWGLQNLA